MADWSDQATDGVERVVVLVRERTVVPAQRVAKAMVYGVLAAAFLVPAAILAVISVFRVLTYIPGGVWVAWLILGGIFVVGGLLCWRMRGSRPEPKQP